MTALADEFGIDTPTGKAGSVLFFDCNTMHGSAGNISPYPRSNLFFVYNSVENRLVDPYCGLAPRPHYIATRD
jgi:ectoine hydroxylase